jgi:transcriptional regulator with XRE-family HTH domain
MSSIGSRIEEVRRFFRLKQKDFAQKIKISRSHVSMLESGQQPPSDRVLALIVLAFGVNEHWLRTGEGDMLTGQGQGQTRSPAADDKADYAKYPPDLANLINALMEVMASENAGVKAALRSSLTEWRETVRKDREIAELRRANEVMHTLLNPEDTPGEAKETS